MDYENIEITIRSYDSAIEAIALIELGITSARDVARAKRQGQIIQRDDHDVMDGSLYQFNIVWSTIIATLWSSKGTEKRAFSAPSTGVVCDKRVDLPTGYGIAGRKPTLEVVTVDLDTFAVLEGDA